MRTTLDLDSGLLRAAKRRDALYERMEGRR
jgi:hypothetical protein